MNDIAMPHLPLWGNVLITILAVIAGIVFHEQAHYKKLREYYPAASPPRFWRKGWRFGFGVSWPDDVLTNEENDEVLMFGIMMGVFPVLLVMFIIDPLWMFAGLGLYLVGCWSDFRTLWRR